jgi:Flp pilus assembly protein CpaB
LVDIIGVFESAGDVGDAQGAAMRNHAMVLVQATKVLAVDNSLSDIRLRTGQESGGGLFSRSGGGGRSEPASVQQSYLLTLDVTVQEAWKLSLATQIGHVRCVARHRGNTQKQEYGPVPPVTERLKGAEVFGAGGKTIWPSGQPKPEMPASEAP